MKKALALILVLVLALGMSTVAFASKPKVDRDPTKNPNWASASAAGTVDITGDDITDGNEIKVQDGYEYKIYLLASQFALDSDSSTGFAATTLTTSEINTSNLSVRIRASKGSQVIDEVSLKKSNKGVDTHILVKFVDVLQNNNPDDGIAFDFRVYLVVDGKNWTGDDMAVHFSGNYVNELEEGYGADNDYFDFSGGVILKPDEFIRRMDGDLGCGVIVDMRALKNARYWGVANEDISEADTDLMIKYAAIDQVKHVQQISIKNVANFVTLDDADPSAYVYDGDLNYLGRGNSHLPLVDTYYLASSELDIDTEPEEEPEEEEGDEDYSPDENVESGGDDLYPSNPHDNPGTGK